MKRSFQWLTLFLSLVLAFTLALSSCTPGVEPETTGTKTQVPEDNSGTEAAPDKNLNIRIMVLSGTTGFGMAPLMDKASNGTSTLTYSFSVCQGGE